MNSRFGLMRLVSILVIGVVLIAGCSPKFNWREVPNNDLGYVATFPDKPVSATRDLNLANLTIPLTLHAAKIDDLYFTVGTVPLSGTLVQQKDLVAQVLAQSLANNVGLSEVALTDVTWQGGQAQYIDLSGAFPNGEPAVVRAYFVVKNDHLFEVVLMGAQAQLTDVTETQWFTGFKWLRN